MHHICVLILRQFQLNMDLKFRIWCTERQSLLHTFISKEFYITFGFFLGLQKRLCTEVCRIYDIISVRPKPHSGRSVSSVSH